MFWKCVYVFTNGLCSAICICYCWNTFFFREKIVCHGFLDKRNMQRAASWFIIESLKIKALIRRLTWCEQKAFKEKVGTLTGRLQEKYWDERVKTVHCLFRQALVGWNFKKMEEVCSIKSHHSNANQNGKWETPTVQRNLVSFVVKVKVRGKVYMRIHTLLISQFLASIMLPPQHYGHLSFNPHLI